MRPHLIFLFLIILTACARKPDPNLQIQVAVASTLAAIPTSTAAPFSTPYPSPTAFDLGGLFCEYQFCIGHPIDMAFYDVSAVTSNQGSPSTYQTGLMAAYSANLLIQLIWQFTPGVSDPQPILGTILDEQVDTRVGSQEVKLIRDMNVIYTPITSTATTLLPYGGAAAWICGDRAFAWKVYSPDEASPPALFDGTLARFTCKR